MDDLVRQRGVPVEALALSVLRDRLLGSSAPFHPHDEWERRLLAIGVDCGVSRFRLSNAAVSSEGMYD